MFSLDVVVWKGKRSEHEAALKKAKQRTSTSTLPRVVQDKKVKQIYGKTPQEMHESYLARVDRWMQDAPTQDWPKTYGQENYSKAYVPRERHKDKDLGGPVVKIGSYSPRAVYKGGGQCIRQLADKDDTTAPPEPRELYQERVANVAKTREKHKEIHPPMQIPKSKPLTCGKYFHKDILCTTPPNNQTPNQTQTMCRKCAANCTSPERSSSSSDDADKQSCSCVSTVDVSARPFFQPIHSRVRPSTTAASNALEPPLTAEYVASPQWRPHSPHKWLARRDFAATAASSTTHTATRTGIAGAPYSPSVRLGDRFVPCGNGELTPTAPAIAAFEHARRTKTAALSLQTQRSPQRLPKTYFSSMWSETTTQPQSANDTPATTQTAIGPMSPVARLGGRGQNKQQ